jgi:hypothetical protein
VRVRVVVVATIVVGAYLALVGYEGFRHALLPLHLLTDDYNRSVYWDHAQFLPNHQVPYVDVPSEYPTIATLSFAVPLLFAPAFRLSQVPYYVAWSAFMAVWLVATIWFIAAFRVRRGLSAVPALLLLMPSPLYFAIMRFDILCAYVVCASLAAFAKRRYVVAHVLLGIATYIKWYPALLFPVYMAAHLAERPPMDMRPATLARTPAAKWGSAFLVTIAVITAGSILAFTWRGFLVPVKFHAVRGGQYFNLYWLLEHWRAPLALPTLPRRILNVSFLALQFSIVPILFVKRVSSMHDVFRYAMLAIVIFITFSRIDSPEWILWYIPVALMFARRRRTLVAIACLGCANYLVFPLGYFTLWPSMAFSAVVFAKDVVLAAALAAVMSEPLPAPESALQES